jgi:hypothetical protein
LNLEQRSLNCDARRVRTPEHVVRAYWERAAGIRIQANEQLTHVHNECFGYPLLNEAEFLLWGDPVQIEVENTEQRGDSAVVITLESFRLATIGTRTLRVRYQLAAANGDWRIVGLDNECTCRNKPNEANVVCLTCGGKGWYHSRRRIAIGA